MRWTDIEEKGIVRKGIVESLGKELSEDVRRQVYIENKVKRWSCG